MKNIIIFFFLLSSNFALGQTVYLNQDTSFVYLKCENEVCFTEINFEKDSFFIIEGEANIEKMSESCLTIKPYSKTLKLSIKDSIYVFKTLPPKVSNNYKVFLDNKIIKDNSRILKIDRNCKPCILRIEDKPNELMEFLFGKQKPSIVLRFSILLARNNKAISYHKSNYTEFHDLSELLENTVEGDEIHITTELVRIFCGDNAYFDTSTHYLIVFKIE